MTLNVLPGYLDDSIFHTSIGSDHSIKVWQWQKYKRGYLDNALMDLLDHSKRVQEWQQKHVKLRLKNLVKISCTITMFYIQCVAWVHKGDFQTRVKIAVRMVYNITMFRWQVTWLCKGDFQTQVKIVVRMVYNVTIFHKW
jgi:hypothetical protein